MRNTRQALFTNHTGFLRAATAILVSLLQTVSLVQAI